MLPAAAAFDVAIHHSCPPRSPKNSSDAVVVHVTVFRESERPSACAGSSLVRLEHNLQLVPEPMVYLVDTRPVLNTACGRWMIQHRMLKPAFACLVGILVILSMTGPGQTKKKVPDPNDEKNIVEVVKPSLVTLAAKISVIFAIQFFAAHISCRSLLRITATYFEPLMIIISALMGEIAEQAEMYLVYPHPTEFTGIFIAFATLHGVGKTLIHVLLALSDALIIRKRWKLWVALAFAASLAFLYFRSRYVRTWSKTQLCAWSFCMTPGHLHQVALFYELLFMLKLVGTYCLGYPYAVLRASFISSAYRPYASEALDAITLWWEKAFGLTSESRMSMRHSLLWGTPRISGVEGPRADASHIGLPHLKDGGQEHVPAASAVCRCRSFSESQDAELHSHTSFLATDMSTNKAPVTESRDSSQAVSQTDSLCATDVSYCSELEVADLAEESC